MIVKRYTFAYITDGESRYLGAKEYSEGSYVFYTDYAALEAEVAGLRKDADRYRKLRIEGLDLADILKLIIVPRTNGKPSIQALRHTHYLDTALDALTQPEQDDE